MNDVDTQVEFKSHQWFGAVVRVHHNTVLVSLARLCLFTFQAILTITYFCMLSGPMVIYSTFTTLFVFKCKCKLTITKATILVEFKPKFLLSLHPPQACAPRYYWRTEHETPVADVTGTCYLSVDGLRTFVEYAPCRTGKILQYPQNMLKYIVQSGHWLYLNVLESWGLKLDFVLTLERHGPAGQGYCQGGFSADFTKVRRAKIYPVSCLWYFLFNRYFSDYVDFEHY